MALIERCLWDQLLPECARKPALQGEAHADVCVIGAGISGLSTALHLLEGGQRVCLLEAQRIGHGGSGRNVGLVNAGTWIAPDDVEQRLGTALGARLNQALGAAPALVFGLIERYGIDCQLHRAGTLHMAHNARGAAELQSRHGQWRRRGAPVELLYGAECQALCGTSKIGTALLDQRAGTLNPLAYTRGLADAVTALGGALYEDSPVVELQRQGENWCVQTTLGAVLAPQVVIASNAYTEGDWCELRRQFFAGYYYQVASRPLSGAAADAILPNGQGAWDTRQVLSSVRRDAEGRLLLGSLGNGCNKPAWFLRRWAERIQRHYFPRLGRVEWQYTWSGRIAFTPEHLLRVFEPAPGLLAVTGYNGRGITTGSLVGKTFAEYLLHGDPQALPLPFSALPAVSAAGVRSRLYESGFTLYHLGQCLRVVI
jgi:glycine/D-amino acid oxidase-like deaminating enzyme